MEEKPKVVILGAGPTGLVAARHLKDVADVQVFESKEDIGGLWNYSDINEYNHPDLKSDMFYNLYGCLHGSIYKDLIMNLPKQCMTYKDFCISKEYPTFMTHQQFHLYLQQYSEHFSLYDIIKFKTTVKSVKIDESAEHKYKVTTVPTDMKEGIEETISYYDYVVVCTGHYSVPQMPNFEGEDVFKGNLYHVHSFKKFTSEDFEDKNVLIVGSSVSACDLGYMSFKDKISEFEPRKIYYAVRSLDASDVDKSFTTDKIEYKLSNVSKIKEESVIFEDGSELEIDTIIYATGYKYCLPFFDPEDKIVEFEDNTNSGHYFGPLYKKMFSITLTNFGKYLNIITKVVSKYNVNSEKIFERQAQICKQYIAGDLPLPDKRAMLDELNSELERNKKINYSIKKFFKFNSDEGGYSYDEYYQSLSLMSNLKTNSLLAKMLKLVSEVITLYHTVVLYIETQVKMDPLVKKEKAAT